MNEITLDDAQRVVIDALNAFTLPASGSAGIDSAGDGGAARHERVVEFTVVAPDGRRASFCAVITTDEEDES